MHWHILGAGAIGLLWAAKFQRAGFNTTLLLRNLTNWPLTAALSQSWKASKSARYRYPPKR
ncbi:ketopantoate reductase family protein [Aliamphritea spongicola]